MAKWTPPAGDTPVKGGWTPPKGDTLVENEQTTASSSEPSRRMVDVNGNSFDIPFSKVEEAANKGFEFTTPMQDANGKMFHIPNSRIEEAAQTGLKDTGVPQLYSPFEKKQMEAQTAKNVADESMVDKFGRKFLSGGGNDIRNIASGAMGGAPVAVGQALASGASALARNAPAIAATGKQALQQGRELFAEIASSPIGRGIAKSASSVYGGAKNLVDKAATGVTAYYGAKAFDEAKKAKNDIFGE